jgi:hypothetical protein
MPMESECLQAIADEDGETIWCENADFHAASIFAGVSVKDLYAESD